MPRLTLTPETPVPQELQARFDKVTAPGSGLADTYRALFANPRVASGLADLDELVGQCDMELWITYTVALAVAHERNSVSIWNAFEPLAREAGAVSLAFTACYYDMMAKLNGSFALDSR